MQIITDQVYAFSKDNKPCATAKPGEVLQFNTEDCFSNRIPDENTTMADLDYTYGFANPAAGPRVHRRRRARRRARGRYLRREGCRRGHHRH